MKIRNEVNFAIVPEWLIYGDVSPQAVRLYAALHRHADRSGKAHPSRRRLAELLRVTTKTIDRAIDELERCGAMTVEARVDQAGDPTSNRYLLRVSPLETQMSLGRDTDVATPGQESPHGRDTDVATGRDIDVPLNESHIELEPDELERERARRSQSRRNIETARWKPTVELLEWAADSHPTVDLVNETEKFIDHFTANGKPMKDWNAAWRNWIRRAPQFNKAVTG